MPRIRGHLAVLPEGPEAWALLNETLFGRNDIGGHSVAVRPEVLPWSWSDTFGRVAPLHLEIGFNRGRFLQAMAAKHPERDFVGIEIRRRFCWRLAHILNAEEENNRNIRIVWADAKNVSPALFAPGSLEGIYVTFPDPWWKKRHFKRRLVDTAFAASMASLLAPGGRVWVKSDVQAIAEEIAQSLTGDERFGETVPFGDDVLPFTHREGNCVAAGLPIHRFFVTRKADEDTPPRPTPK